MSTVTRSQIDDHNRAAKTQVIEVIPEVANGKVDIHTANSIAKAAGEDLSSMMAQYNARLAQKRNAEALRAQAAKADSLQKKLDESKAAEATRRKAADETHRKMQEDADNCVTAMVQRDHHLMMLRRDDLPHITAASEILTEAARIATARYNSGREQLQQCESIVPRLEAKLEQLAGYMPGRLQRAAHAVTGRIDNVERQYADTKAQLDDEKKALKQLRSDVTKWASEQQRISELQTRLAELRYKAWPLPSEVDAIVMEL